jgi:DNA-binding IclR family transcriptional regulator
MLVAKKYSDRILQTMEAEGFIEQEPLEGRYLLVRL